MLASAAHPAMAQAPADGMVYNYLPWPGAARDKYTIVGDCGGGMVKIRKVDSSYEQCAKVADMKPVPAPPADGAKGSLPWFVGNWSMSYVGATVDSVQGNALVRKEETGAKGGVLQIKPDRTYIWPQPNGAVRGTWRPATAAELQRFEGLGVVLEHGESGWDWIVVKQQDTSIAADQVEVLDLGTHNLRRLANRVK